MITAVKVLEAPMSDLQTLLNECHVVPSLVVTNRPPMAPGPTEPAQEPPHRSPPCFVSFHEQ